MTEFCAGADPGKEGEGEERDEESQLPGSDPAFRFVLSIIFKQIIPIRRFRGGWIINKYFVHNIVVVQVL